MGYHRTAVGVQPDACTIWRLTALSPYAAGLAAPSISDTATQFGAESGYAPVLSGVESTSCSSVARSRALSDLSNDSPT
jgi:hypothetical protein